MAAASTALSAIAHPRLNLAQRKFVDYYAIHQNATQAAKAAGYSEKTAHSQGCRLLKHPAVAAALRTIFATVEETADKASTAARQELLEYWTNIIRRPVDLDKLSVADQLRASEYLGRAHRMFHDEVAGATAFAISIHLNDESQQPAVDVTPEKPA